MGVDREGDLDDSPASLTDRSSGARFVVVSQAAGACKNSIQVLSQGLKRVSSLLQETKRSAVTNSVWAILLDLSALGDPRGRWQRFVEAFPEQACLTATAVLTLKSTALLANRQLRRGRLHTCAVRAANSLARCRPMISRFPKLDACPMAREALTAGYVLASSADLGWTL